MWYVTVTAVAGDTRRYIGEFYCGVTADTTDYWCPMDLSYHAECDFELSCDDADAPADLFSKVEAGGSAFDRADLYPDLYREP